MGDGSSRGRCDSTLSLIGELFGSIGWEKRLCDLSEEEVIAIALILKKLSEGLDDEYAGTNLMEIYFKYGGGRIGLQESDIPF